MLVSTPLGTMAAYALYVSGHPAARAIFFFLITPMIVPVILIAIGTFYVFGRIGLNNTISGLVLAHTKEIFLLRFHSSKKVQEVQDLLRACLQHRDQS